MRKCMNCGELLKECKKGKKQICRLRLPMIWQLIQPDKIGNIEKCFRALHMNIEPIGKDDFRITMG